jgi:GNAT superfamily N-acetyltransferase
VADPRCDVRIGRHDNPRDVADLAALSYDWRVLERGDTGMALADFTRDLGTWMHEHRDTHLPFLASVDGQAMAMAWLAIVNRVPGPVVFTRTCAYVQSAFVRSAQRNGGIGSELLSQLIEHGRALGLDYIAVHPSVESFTFYRRLGFSGTDRVLELDFRPDRPRAVPAS